MIINRKTVIKFGDSTFTFRETLFPTTLKVFHNGTIIGLLNLPTDTFIIISKDIFYLYDGFGVPSDLLLCQEIPFTFVKTDYEDVTYKTTRNKFVKSNKKKCFGFGEKKFLSRKEFNLDEDSHQLKLNF